ncbi:GH18134 [Drosophila grimshawi]|uniref:GH18134 n=1 Tax=Drosophila grimshawi TaxID=7222 RepID=B4JGL4_DROGR|nr:GH18134 [Drosophila grimshawi]
MDRLRMLMVLSVLSLGAVSANSFKPFVENDCGFADREDLHFMCHGEISDQFEDDWDKVSPPMGTVYSIWQTSHDLVAMAAFYDRVLFEYDTIMIDPAGARVEVKHNNGDYHTIRMPKSQVFCFNTELPFVSALLHTCLGQDHVLREPRHTILFYASPEGAIEAANMISSSLILTLLTVLLVAVAKPIQ